MGWRVEVALTALTSLRPEKSGTTRGKGKGNRMTQLGGVEWGSRDESKIVAQWEVSRKPDVKYTGVVVSEWREGAQPEGRDRGQYLALIRGAESKMKLKKRGAVYDKSGARKPDQSAVRNPQDPVTVDIIEPYGSDIMR